MKNKTAGILLIAIAGFIGVIIWLFNRALNKIVTDSCSHGLTCPMWGNISFHTNLSIAIMVFVALIGLFLFFFGKDEVVREIHRKTIVRDSGKNKPFKRSDYDDLLERMDEDDRLVFGKILDAKGTLHQSTLVEQTSLSKVKVTRILDRLEGKGLIERKRRGMTNVVLLKH